MEFEAVALLGCRGSVVKDTGMQSNELVGLQQTKPAYSPGLRISRCIAKPRPVASGEA